MNTTQPTLPLNFIALQSGNLSTSTQGASMKLHLNGSNGSPDAFERGFSEARMHLPATTLMGIGCLLMNFIPGFKMSWPMSIKMASANMAMMLMIAFGLGAYRSKQGHVEHQM